MEQLLLSQVKDHKSVAITVTAIIYLWSIFYRTSYLSFLSGMATTVLIEAILFWFYLGTRVQAQEGKKLTLELAKMEARKIFGDDVGVNYHEVEMKLKKKKYYENNRSKFSLEAFKPRPKIEVAVEPQTSLKDEVATPTESTIPQSPAFSHKQINELLKLKERELNREKVDIPIPEKDGKKIGLEDKVALTKVGHKAFIEQINTFLNILACIGQSEKNYAKVLSNFDSKHIMDDSSLAKGEEITLNLFKIKSLNEKDTSLLVTKFGKEFTDQKYLYLPEWKTIKHTIHFLGQLHGNCYALVNKTSIPNINKLMAEYEEKYQERKKEKKKLTREYEEIYLTYTKLKAEYETLNKTLETTLSEYQSKFKKKRDDEVVLKHEMKARLVKSQLDTLANKVSNASDKLQDAIKAMVAENNKISQFTHHWDEKKEAVCYEILKRIIIILAENNTDAEKSFELLIQTRSSAAQSKNEIKDQSPAVAPGEEMKLEIEREPSDKFKDIAFKLKQPSSPMVDSANKPKPRPKRSSFKGKDLDENKVARMVEDFKDTIEEFTQIYNDDLATYNEEFKKSKDITVMLKQMADFEDEYTKERDKLVSFNFLNLKVDTLAKFWKMIQNNVYLVNRSNTHLHERLINLEKSYEEFIKNQEKDLKACDLIIQNAIKRASTFTKSMEKDLLKKEMHKDKKDFFSKLFNNDEKEPEIDDVAIVTEKCLFTEEIEKGLAQINTLIVRSQKKTTVLKKDMLVAYLKCFNGQKDLSLSLTNETEKLDPLIKHPQEETKDDGSKNEGVEERKDNPEEAAAHKSSTDSKPEEQKESDIVLNQVPKETELEKPGEPLGPEGLALLNRMFKVFAMEWSKSGYFKEKISKSLFRALNKKPSKFVRRIKIKDLIIEPKFPELRSVTPLPCDSFEFLYDAEMAYQGNILLEIETRLEPQPVISFFSGDQPIPLTAKVLIKSLNAKVRICWVPSDYGRSWYSFVGQPILNMSIEPKIGVSQFDITALPQATSIISDLIMKKIKKMTFPYRKELDLPMAFRDPKIVPPPE